MLTGEQFLQHLRSALNHLYDPRHLHRSPLANLFGVADRPDTPLALRRILIEAIESLRPDAEVPSQARAWRIYDLLHYRYVQQFSQQEVADQLGLSVRHLRREQRTALEALALRLWEGFHLELELNEGTSIAAASAADAPPTPPVSEELAWLKNASPEGPTALGQILTSVVDLAQPLAAQHRIRLKVALADNLPDLSVHSVALRQALLSLVGVAIHRAAGGQVCISARPVRWEAEVQVWCTDPPPDPEPIAGDDVARLDMAQRLAHLCGGRLALSTDEAAFRANLILPALEQLPVLAIDDNADTLQLMQRYTSGTRYRVVGTRDPEQALRLAEELSPQIVVLDVMMPQVDGWEVLGRLREHPRTGHIPIIVCTILAEEELALSLGASAFVRKPVTRQAFLAALDREVARMETEPG